MDQSKELLEQEPENRYVLFPIKYPDIWESYKKQMACFWTAEEIDLTKDLSDWEKLNENEQYFIKNVLAFFAGSDGIVLENLVERFMNDVKIPEARCAYGFQAMMESIHSEVYSLLIDTYIKDKKEKDILFKAIDKIPCVAKKAKWALKWIGDKKSNFATRLLAFACVEGIFFSGSFCAIYWLKQRGLMPGLTFSNELISRDEAMHCDFACLLYSKIKNRLNQKTVHNIVKDAMEMEKEFIINSLPCSLIGMNSKKMIQYLEYVADRLVMKLGYEKIYSSENPFPFMELISLDSKANFFEKRNGNYRMAKVGSKQEDNNISFDDDEDDF